MTNPALRRSLATGGGAVLLVGLLASCGEPAPADDVIEISGSATVAPISEAVAARGGFDVDIDAEGTTDGFERFCSGETPIQNASVAIPGEGQITDYLSMCEENDVEFVEIPIGLDALSLIRNESNRFARDMTLEEIQRTWEPDSEIATWADIRTEWPDEEIVLFGRPEGSGTFEYFSNYVSGEAGEMRVDYQATDDLDELANWIAEEPNGLGFMGVGNYLAADGEDRDRITNVSVDGVAPTLNNAQDGSYEPFTRPLFIYVNAEHAESDERVVAYVDHYVDVVEQVLPAQYFYPLSEAEHEQAAQRWHSRTTGSEYGGNPFG